VTGELSAERPVRRDERRSDAVVDPPGSTLWTTGG
jgi:hypothetical protein